MVGKINQFPSSEYAILGFLSEGSCHGYDLHKRITNENGIGMVWGVKISNLYAQLDKLEHKGLISGILQPGEMKPARKVYSLTSEGHRVFEAWIQQLVKHPRDFRQEFMVRVFFSLNKPELLERITKSQLEECRSWLRTIEEKKVALTKEGSFQNTVVHFRISQIQSMVDWLEWIIVQISKTKSQKGVK